MKFATAWTDSSVERAFESLRAKVSAPLAIELWDGRVFELSADWKVKMRVPRAAALKHLVRPTLGSLAEAYVEGDIDVEGSPRDVIKTAHALAAGGGSTAWDRITQGTRRHTRKVDREAIRRHYDVSNEFYQLWLDRRMVYSCAYFRTGDEDIDTAQTQKLDHICRKLSLQPGEKFLDIGCGWGGLIIHAAKEYGVDATGITLSENQFETAQARIREAGVEDRCRVELIDYRDVQGEGVFDKIASIGMFEHVGLRNLSIYFGTVRRLLRERGLFLNHGITSSDVESRDVGSDAGGFIDKYVFPEGEVPHVALALREMAAQNLEVADVESLRPHYARTLEQWSDRLEEHLAEAAKIVDAKTLRIWRVYLMGCSYGFAQGWMNIYQILASRQTADGKTDLPWTREYMYRV
ncbi:MAG: cyclopropane-fatty-acyl-phospholipid synthase family protein [Betaproteobacteria bacterium]